jgi:rfaE bifunctional protein kinase chain/domain
VDACTAQVAALGPLHDAILLSDYRGGVIDERTIAAARASGRPIAVDSQGELRRFRGADLVKINQAEATAAVRGADPLEHADELRRELELRELVITLGGRGMAVFAEGGSTLVPAASISQVFDVTGAGDTVIAVLTLALLAGLPPRLGAELANAAAGVVVQRLGVATVTPIELVSALT